MYLEYKQVTRNYTLGTTRTNIGTAGYSGSGHPVYYSQKYRVYSILYLSLILDPAKKYGDSSPVCSRIHCVVVYTNLINLNISCLICTLQRMTTEQYVTRTSLATVENGGRTMVI